MGPAWHAPAKPLNGRAAVYMVCFIMCRLLPPVASGVASLPLLGPGWVSLSKLGEAATPGTESQVDAAYGVRAATAAFWPKTRSGHLPLPVVAED